MTVWRERRLRRYLVWRVYTFLMVFKHVNCSFFYFLYHHLHTTNTTLPEARPVIVNTHCVGTTLRFYSSAVRLSSKCHCMATKTVAPGMVDAGPRKNWVSWRKPLPWPWALTGRLRHDRRRAWETVSTSPGFLDTDTGISGRGYGAFAYVQCTAKSLMRLGDLKFWTQGSDRIRDLDF